MSLIGYFEFTELRAVHRTGNLLDSAFGLRGLKDALAHAAPDLAAFLDSAEIIKSEDDDTLGFSNGFYLAI